MFMFVLNIDKRVGCERVESEYESSGYERSMDTIIKDGAYYCYCAYVLRILRYSRFLLVILTNTGIFFHGLKISGKSRS